jgi:hypothetical protein
MSCRVSAFFPPLAARRASRLHLLLPYQGPHLPPAASTMPTTYRRPTLNLLLLPPKRRTPNNLGTLTLATDDNHHLHPPTHNHLVMRHCHPLLSPDNPIQVRTCSRRRFLYGYVLPLLMYEHWILLLPKLQHSVSPATDQTGRYLRGDFLLVYDA